MFDSILAPLYQQWILQSLLITLLLSAMTIVASTALGIVFAFLRCLHNRTLSLGVLLFGSLFRDTPLLLQMMFWYFCGPQFIPMQVLDWLNAHSVITFLGQSLTLLNFEFIAGCFALTLYSAFFIAEDLRSGVQAVSKGQLNASFALGMTHIQTLTYIVLPQAWRISLPALFGQYMNIVKNSSLVMAIGVLDMTNIAWKINDETGKTFVAFGIATLCYVSINILINIWMHLRLQARTAGI